MTAFRLNYVGKYAVVAMAKPGRRPSWTIDSYNEWVAMNANLDFSLLDRIARIGVSKASKVDLTRFLGFLDTPDSIATSDLTGEIGQALSDVLPDAHSGEAIRSLFGVTSESQSMSFNERVLLSRVKLGYWRTEIDDAVLARYRSSYGPDSAPQSVEKLFDVEKVRIWIWRIAKSPSVINSAFTRPPTKSKSPGEYWNLLRELHEILSRNALPKATPLPIAVDEFFGRNDELAQVAVDVETHRLVSLVGPSGVGKTRLMIEYATRRQHEYGVTPYFVELENCQNAFQAVDRLFQACGVRGARHSAVGETIAAALSESTNPLIILDNCEHLPVECANLIADLLGHSSDLRIITTSVRPLQCHGEHVVRVWGLLDDRAETSPTLNAPMHNPGVRLFVDRAIGGTADSVIDSSDLETVEEIVALLDGLPFAIELAARSTAHRTLDEIVALASHSFVNVENPVAASDRHKTIEACILRNIELLSDHERTSLCASSVFEGGWSLEAAAAILETSSDDSVEKVLERLVECSLVARREIGGHSRYRLLNLTRTYLRNEVADAHVLSISRELHSRWFSDVARRSSDSLGGINADQWLEQLDEDASNIQAAIEHAIADQGPAAVLQFSGLWWYWFLRGQWSEIYPKLEDGLEAVDDADSDIAMGVLATGTMAWAAGKTVRAEQLFETAVASSTHENDWLAAQVQHIQGHIAHHRGEWQRARILFEAALEYWIPMQNSYWEALLRDDIGYLLTDLGDFEMAEGRLEEAWQLARRIGDRQAEGNAASHLSAAIRKQGNPERAVMFGLRAVRALRKLGYRRGLATALRNLAEAEIDCREYALAESHVNEATVIQLDICHEAGLARSLSTMARLGLTTHQLRAASSCQAFANAIMECRELPVSPAEKEERASTNDLVNLRCGSSLQDDLEKEAIRALGIHEDNLRAAKDMFDELTADYF